MRAPSARWLACNGVWRRADAASVTMAPARPPAPPPRRAPPGSRGPLDHRTLRGVGHDPQRLVDLHPADLVELVVMILQAAADRMHQEEVDRLVEARPAMDEEVGDRADRLLDLHPEAGLLARLADRGLGQRLARVGSPLGQRPQRRLAAAHEHDLERRRRQCDGRPRQPMLLGRNAARAPPPLRATGARKPERQEGATRADTADAADRREAELTRR